MAPAVAHVIMFGPVAASPEVEPLLGALRAGLRELGDGGRSIEVAYRGYTPDHTDALLDISAEIDAIRPAAVMAWGYSCARVKGLTVHPPVVFVVNYDPAGLGLVASKRLTGLTTWRPGSGQAQLALLRELVPAARSVAVLWDPSDSGSIRAFNETADLSRHLGWQRRSLEVSTAAGLEAAFSSVAEQGAGALCVLSSPLSFAVRAQIARLAARHRLPTVFDLGEFAEAGGLASYGGTLRRAFRRAAFYVDRILRGANPAGLPVERLVNAELVINLRTAGALGLDLPEGLLARAERRLE